MSLQALTSLVSPPTKPSEVPKNPNWVDVEKKLGITLPKDYKDFVLTFGSGLLGNFVIVCNPFSKSDGVRLESCISLMCNALRELKKSEGERQVPYNIYPDSQGLLPWGGDENGNGLYWLTEGEPNSWPCVIGEGRGPLWQQFNMPMTTFLANALRGDVKCKVWPPRFSNKSRYMFEPY